MTRDNALFSGIPYLEEELGVNGLHSSNALRDKVTSLSRFPDAAICFQQAGNIDVDDDVCVGSGSVFKVMGKS